MRGNYDKGCKLFVIKVSYHMHFQWVSKSIWKDANCQSLLQSKVTLLYVCAFKLNSVHNSKRKHINIKSQSHLKCYSVTPYFRVQEEEEEGEGLLLAVVKFMYVLSEYQKQHNALYVLKGDGFQCFSLAENEANLDTRKPASHIICEIWKMSRKAKRKKVQWHTAKRHMKYSTGKRERLANNQHHCRTAHFYVFNLHGHWLVWSEFEHTSTVQ